MSAATGALEQAAHVFLQGCGLPAAWAGRPQWRVLETRFGTGLNFLATWNAWRHDPDRPGLLHYAAVEAAPLALGELLDGVATYPALQPLAEALASRWNGLVPGFHRLSFENGHVLLTLCVGEPQAMLREQSFRADSVFLDGLAPERDPHAWSLDMVKAVTRLCRRDATLASPVPVDSLRRDLQSCGWKIEQRPGLSPGGPCLAGRHAPEWTVKGLDRQQPPAAAECIVIGAGLAGAAAAASLARRGWRVRVLDTAAGPATGASDLPAGLLAPHQSPDDNLLSRLSRAGVRVTLQEAQQRLARGLEWDRTGVLEWRGADHRPLPAMGEALAVWSREASDGQKLSAGIAPMDAAWWHENAGWIEPAALVHLWLREPGVRFAGGRKVARVFRAGEQWVLEDAAGQRMDAAPLVVVAAALGTVPLVDGQVQLHPVRGQVTWAPRDEDAAALPPFPVNGHGHFLPRVPLVDRDAWITGSTYGRGDADESLRREDNAANLERVREVMPRAAQVMEGAFARREVQCWSGVRCASSDRRPIVGELAPGLWLSTAMGSRGLTFAALCGELIAARLHEEPLPLEARLAQALDLRRLGRARSG